MFIGQFNPTCIHPPHVHKIDQGPQYRLHSALTYFFHYFCLVRLHALVHTLVKIPVGSMFNFLFKTISNACYFNRTFVAVGTRTSVLFLPVSFLVGICFSIRDLNSLLAGVVVRYRIIVKPFTRGFISSKIRNVPSYSLEL